MPKAGLDRSRLINRVVQGNISTSCGAKAWIQCEVLLLLDNGSTHPLAEVLNAISTIGTINYIPPNVMSLIQPVCGVIKNLKKIYKKIILHNTVLHNGLQGCVQFSITWNLVNCCNSLAHAWESVSEPYMFFQMLKLLPDSDATTIEEVIEWLHEDQSEPGWKILSDKEILFAKEEATDDPIVDIASSDDEDYQISPEQIVQGMNNLRDGTKLDVSVRRTM